MARLTFRGGIPEDAYHDWIQVKCQCCGEFLICETLTALWDASNSNRISQDDFNLRHYLSAHTRQATEKREVIRIDENNWKYLAQPHKNSTIEQKSKKLLELIKSRSTRHGENVRIDLTLEYPLIDTSSPSEFEYFLEQLKDQGYISLLREKMYIYHISITFKGYSLLEQQGVSLMSTEGRQGMQINITDSNIGVLNPGEIANVQSITVSLTALANSGNTQIADAIKYITEAVASSQELTPENREEALGLLGDLSKQADLPKENRSSLASLRTIATGVGAICSVAGGLATVWATWGPAIQAFFGF